MKNKLILSIAMSSVVCLNTNLAQAMVNDASTNTDATTVKVEREEVHGGKCAAGKCGTSKAYGASTLTHDPQDYLVYARDGKCGLSGQGVIVNSKKTPLGKCATGVCGQ